MLGLPIVWYQVGVGVDYFAVMFCAHYPFCACLHSQATPFVVRLSDSPITFMGIRGSPNLIICTYVCLFAWRKSPNLTWVPLKTPDCRVVHSMTKTTNDTFNQRRPEWGPCWGWQEFWHCLGAELASLFERWKDIYLPIWALKDANLNSLIEICLFYLSAEFCCDLNIETPSLANIKIYRKAIALFSAQIKDYEYCNRHE